MRTLRGRGLSALCLLVLTFLSLLAVPLHAASAKKGGGAARARYVVMLAADTADVDATASGLASRYDGTIVAVWRHAVKGFCIELTAAKAAKLAREKQVIALEKDAVMEPSGYGAQVTGAASGLAAAQDERHEAPADPLWHLTYLSHRLRAPLNASEASQFYQYRYLNDGRWGAGDADRVRVYIVDMGVWARHAELNGTDGRTAVIEGGPGEGGRTGNAASVPYYLRKRNGIEQAEHIVPDAMVPDRSKTTEPCAAFGDDAAARRLRQSHGTGVASMVVGRHVGVAPGAQVISVISSGCGGPVGSPTQSTSAVLLSALDYVYEVEKAYQEDVVANPTHKLRPAVLSMSTSRFVRSGSELGEPDATVLENAITAILDLGIPVVVSADNQNGDACNRIPARMSRRSGRKDSQGRRTRVITVGAVHAAVGLGAAAERRWVNNHETRATGFELNQGSNYGQCVDLFAPGSHILVAYPGPSDTEYSALHSGTSYSAPMVAGLVARILSTRKELGLFDATPAGELADKAWEWLAANASPFEPGDLRAASEATQPAAAVGPPDQASPRLRAYLGNVTFERQLSTVTQATPAGNVRLGVSVMEPQAKVTFTWYRGEAGDTTTPAPELVPCASPSNPPLPGQAVSEVCFNTTVDERHYWVRVQRTDGCPAGWVCDADSISTTVKLGECERPSIVSQPTAEWLEGAVSPAPLSATIEPYPRALRYEWWAVVPPGSSPRASGTLSPDTIVVPSLTPSTVSEPTTYQLHLCEGTDCAASASCTTRSESVVVRPCADVLNAASRELATAGLLRPILGASENTSNLSVGEPPASIASVLWLRRDEGGAWRTPLVYPDGTWIVDRDVPPFFPIPLVRTGTYHFRVSSFCSSYDSGELTVTAAQILPYYTLTPTETILTDGRYRLRINDQTLNRYPRPNLRYTWSAGVVPSGSGNEAVTGPITQATTITATVKDLWSERVTQVTFELQPEDFSITGVLGASRCSSKTPVSPMVIPAVKYRILELKAEPIDKATNAVVTVFSDPEHPSTFVQNSFFYEWRVNGTVVRAGQGLQYGTYFHEVMEHAQVRLTVRNGPFPPRTFDFNVVLYPDARPEPERLQRCPLLTGTPPANNLDLAKCPGNLVGCPRRQAVRHTGPAGSMIVFQPGEELTFTAPATPLPSNYTWHRVVGTAVTQVGTGETLTLVHTLPAEYYVMTTNAEGTSESYHLLAVPADENTPVTVTPPSREITAGQTASFTAALPGLDPSTLSYEWREGTARLVSAPVLGQSATVTLYGLEDTATFWCRVYENRGELTERYWDSPHVFVTVNCSNSVVAVATARPERLRRGQETMLIPGGMGKQVTYRWTRSDDGGPAVELSTLHNPRVAVTAEVTTFGGTAEDACGQTASISPVSVYLCVPTIETQPSNIVVRDTDPKTLSVVARPAVDGQPLTIRWYRASDTQMTTSLGTGATFAAPVGAGATDSFYAAITSMCGSQPNVVRSDVATVQVCATPVMTTPATLYQTTPTMPVTLVVHGSADDTYLWYRGESGDTSFPLGRTERTYFVNPSVTTRFWVQAKSLGLCTKDSETITVEVCTAPSVSLPPQNTLAFPGKSVTLTALGQSTTHPVEYQWQGENVSGNWIDVAGATTASFATPPFQDTARYRVMVKAAHCSTPSAAATVGACAYSETVSGKDLIIEYNSRATLTLPVLMPMRDKTVTWYQGAVGDKSTPVGTGLNISYTTEILTQTTLYWAELNVEGCVSRTGVYTVRPCDPAVTTQPAGTLITSGSSATLTVGATPVPGLTYQWYAGEVGTTTSPVANGTGSSVTVSPVADTSYWCRVSTPCGRADDSVAALVQVCRTPQFITQPYTYSIRSGSSQTLIMNVTDGDLYTYQWYRGERGVTTYPLSSTSRTASVSPTVTTSYWMRATHLGQCSADSPTLVVDVCTPPTMTVQPLSQSIQSGSSVTLTAAASSTRTLSYQWYRGPSGDASLIIAGATAASLTVSPTTETSYWCRITTSVCSVDSAAATISMCAYPALVKSSPPAVSAYSGQVVTLEIGALSPVLPKNITWYKGTAGDISTPVKSGVGTDLSYSRQVTVNEQYWAEFTHNGCVTRTGTYAINVCRPTITTSPQSSTIASGTNASLSVAATGSPLTYQWYVGNSGDTSQPVAGQTASTFSPAPATTTSYWVRVTGCTIAADSATATVTVCVTPAITSLTKSAHYTIGSTGSITVTATGANLQYQWYKGQSGDVSRPIANATSATYSFVLQNTEYYWVRVSTTCSNASVNSATLLFSVEAHVTAYFTDMTIPRNTSTTLSVTAQGTYLTYQWYRDNDVLIAGATSSTYTTPALSTTTYYRVNVGSGTLPGVNGPYKTITLCDGPSVLGFTSTSSSGTYTLSVNVAVNDRPDARYRWYRGVRGDTAQSTYLGEFNSSLSMYAPVPGVYWVRVLWSNLSCYTDTIGKTIP